MSAEARASTGVLLVNTGTPAAPTAGAVRRFLRPFLSDPRVVELPRWLWLPLLNCVILPLRAPRSAANYRKVWLPGGSPLAVHSAALAGALQAELDQLTPARYRVGCAFLYSEPAVAATLQSLCAAGCTRIIVLPMFPQYSGTTTAAVHDQVGVALRALRALPELRLLRDYHADARYIAALAGSVRAHWQQHERSNHLLMSFHGIPQRCVTLGDPYETQCRATAGALAAALELRESQWTLSFQSRFGKARWLEPATDRTLQQLGKRRLGLLDVICPGFAVDCLETLEEIAIGGSEIFRHAGGGELRYIGALNGAPEHARALAQVALAT
jgi:protoporphyrin/coproporphyrin ferrochelatase